MDTQWIHRIEDNQPKGAMSDSMNTKRRKKPRSVMADDSQWRLVASRARAAGMSISQFVIERVLEPARPAVEADPPPAALQRSAAVDLRTLVLAERLRFEKADAGTTWRRLVEEAEASVAADEAQA